MADNPGTGLDAAQATMPRLLAEVRARGIEYLRGPADLSAENAAVHDPLPTATLFRALAASGEPRVRDAIIGVLLLHPELAREALRGLAAARANGDHTTAEVLATRVLATLYLQRLWYPALSLAFGQPPRVPEQYFVEEWITRGLPAPGDDFGASGLRQLLNAEQQRMGISVDLAGDLQNQVDRLLHQEWTRRLRQHAPLNVAALAAVLASPNDDHAHEYTQDHARGRAQEAQGRLQEPFSAATAERSRSGERGERREATMSFRPDVSRTEIERFLQALGQAVRQPGRIYLVGGAALVHAQVRALGATTADIDLVLSVADEQQVQSAIRGLITQLGVNVELAGPADFIPLPASWEASSRYVGRYGALDVFYLDFTTLALAKIERSTSRDVRDVELLAAQGLIDRAGLETAYREIRPQLGQGRFFNVDPVQFDQKMQVIIQRVWGQPSP